VAAYLGINPQLCTGCRTCVLACSFEHFNVFSFEKSFIGVTRDEEAGTFQIIVKDGCVPCRICEDNCLFGALTYIQNEE